MDNPKEYKENYLTRIPEYENLGKNLSSAIELLLEENKLDFLKVYYRIKEVDSFIEKIARKKYDKPFDQIEDVCGIRIICYYQKDVDTITDILKKELDVKESSDKEELLDINQFGYRSFHLIASIPSSWFKTPNFRKLKGLKAEIQVRTVLMHAWAEIEHKLSYKKKSHIPDHFKRKLYRLSAKLEESDEQFQELKEQSVSLQKNIIEKAKSDSFNFGEVSILDLDTFQAYLDFMFPNRAKDIKETRNLLDELQELKIPISAIEEGYNKIKPYQAKLEKPIINAVGSGWAQVGIVRNILDYTNDTYYNYRSIDFKKEISEWKKKLGI